MVDKLYVLIPKITHLSTREGDGKNIFFALICYVHFTSRIRQRLLGKKNIELPNDTFEIMADTMNSLCFSAASIYETIIVIYNVIY